LVPTEGRATGDGGQTGLDQLSPCQVPIHSDDDCAGMIGIFDQPASGFDQGLPEGLLPDDEHARRRLVVAADVAGGGVGGSDQVPRCETGADRSQPLLHRGKVERGVVARQAEAK
jgi:hypothetical protein